MTVATAPPQIQSDTEIPGYAKVPNSVLRDASLSVTARLLYSVLDGRRADRGQRVSLSVLAADLGVSESTVRRAAGELEGQGLLKRSRTGRTNSWRLTNPVRTAGNRIVEQHAATESDQSPVPPKPAKPVTSAGSDQSPVTGLQRTTRENYNNNAGRSTTDTELVSDYLTGINAATGSTLVQTRALQQLVTRIAAAGIPANEAALTAAAWLAAKGNTVQNVNGFLASIVLPSMANGQELENPHQKETPIPPAYRDVIAADRTTPADPETAQRGISACRSALKGTSRD